MIHWKYLKYIVRHKWFVFQAGLKTGAPLWRLLIHDWSKFLPSEWFPYARFFYGDQWDWDRIKYLAPGYPYKATRQGAADAFDRAWLHHQHANPHHWQYWILRCDDGRTNLLPMPEKFIREMVADWAGAGRAITGKWEVAPWYWKNRHLIQIDRDTRARVEKLLQLFPAEDTV